MTALEYLRKVNKVSKKELSEHLGINQRTYENKEQGETEFTFSEAYKVAKFFGVSMENLYKLLTTTVEE